jgi:hypothetical protein
MKVKEKILFYLPIFLFENAYYLKKKIKVSKK